MSRVGAIRPAALVLLAASGCDQPSGVGGPPDGGSVLLTGAAAEAEVSCPYAPTLWIPGAAGSAASSAAPDWSLRFGDSSDDAANAVAAGADGAPILLSNQYGVVDFGTGPYALPTACWTMLSAFSPAGALRWSRSVAIWSPNGVMGPDGGPILVMTNSSLARLTPAGQVRWVWKSAAPIDSQVGASADALYTVLAGVWGNGAYPTTIKRLTLDGAPSWSFTYPATGWPAFDVSSTDEVVFATEFTGTTVLGGQTFQSAGATDFIVAKLGADGKLRWARQFGSTGDDGSPSVSLGPDGSVVLLGYGGGALDFGSGPLAAGDADVTYLARLDGEGNAVAGRAVSDTWFGWSLRQTPSGQIVMAGNFSSPVTIEGTAVHTGAMGDEDFLVVEASPSFDVQKILHFGNGGGNQQLVGFAVDGLGGVLLAGRFQGKLDLGAGTLRSAGGQDVFLGRVQP